MSLPLTKDNVRVRRRPLAFLWLLPPVYPWGRLGIGVPVVLAISVVAGGIGAVFIPPLTLLSIVADRLPGVSVSNDWPDSWETIVWRLRMPRIVLTALVGAALGISGATYQGLFRNPLADPYLIGVASGAGLGATIVLLTAVPHFFAGFSVLPLAAFAGGMLAVSLAYAIAKRSGGLQLTTLILAGVAITSLTGAVTSLLIIRSSPDVRPLLGWLFGGFIGASWNDVLTVLPYVIAGSLIMVVYSRILNMLQADEHEAKQMGVNVERTKLLLISTASLTTAAAVSVSGLIGFVGLIAPHTVRLVWGHDHRSLLPMSMLVGAGFLVLADIVARTAASPSELPVGVVTAFCGTPFFLYLLRRRGRPGV
jgi:iron complex transport system permease protein